jgi:hypothetical protein
MLNGVWTDRFATLEAACFSWLTSRREGKVEGKLELFRQHDVAQVDVQTIAVSVGSSRVEMWLPSAQESADWCVPSHLRFFFFFLFCPYYFILFVCKMY